MTTAQGGVKVVSLTHRLHLPPENPPGTQERYKCHLEPGEAHRSRTQNLYFPWYFACHLSSQHTSLTKKYQFSSTLSKSVWKLLTGIIFGGQNEYTAQRRARYTAQWRASYTAQWRARYTAQWRADSRSEYLSILVISSDGIACNLYCQVRMLTRAPTVLTKVFCGIPHSFPVNAYKLRRFRSRLPFNLSLYLSILNSLN